VAGEHRGLTLLRRTMALLSERDQQTVRTQLDALTTSVTLLFFTQTIGAPETALVARRIVDEVAALSDHVSVEEVNVVLERARAEAFGVEDVPAIAVLANGVDTRIRFLGAPAGYEFLSLVEAVIAAGTGDSRLSAGSRTLIAKHVTTPVDIKVFVTPTCSHCPRAVTVAHRMALHSPLITATCVEATEFLDLSRRYRVTGVPKTVVNGTREILGALPEEAFVEQIVTGTSGDTMT
jgi:glutaredoxin-like protein